MPVRPAGVEEVEEEETERVADGGVRARDVVDVPVGDDARRLLRDALGVEGEEEEEEEEDSMHKAACGTRKERGMLAW